MGTLGQGLPAAILSMMEEVGELTAMEAAEAFGVTRHTAHSAMHRLNTPTAGGLQRAYIKRWVYEHIGSRRYPRASYAAGDKPDAPKPKPDEKRNKAVYWAKRKKRIVTAAPSVFALGAQVLAEVEYIAAKSRKQQAKRKNNAQTMPA